MAYNPVAFIAAVDGGKREFALYDEICNIIGKQILPSLTDKRCPRHQAEITFSSKSNEAELTAIGSTALEVKKKGASKVTTLQVDESITIAAGDWFALTPEPNVKFELQIVNPVLTKKNSNSNMASTSTTTTTPTTTAPSGEKRKWVDDDTEIAAVKHMKHAHVHNASDSDDADDSNKAPHKSKKKKLLCKYGASCYRKNKEHLAMYTHSPVNSDNSEDDQPKPKPTHKKESKLKISAVFDDDRVDEDENDEKPSHKPTKPLKISATHTSTKKQVNDDDDGVLKNVLGGDSDDEDDGNILAKGKEKDKSFDGEDGDEDENAVKPLKVMEEGEIYKVQGSSDEYRLKLVGGVYSCTCHAWKNQSLPIGMRTCKHLIEYLGNEHETWRLQRPLTAKPPASQKKGAPGLLLAHKWEEKVNPKGWWMSEKLDGVRAYWDGSVFLSRLGNVFPAPDWFTEQLPKDFTLDGELWCGRKMFQKCVSVVKSKETNGQWKNITYQVFDCPNISKPVEERFEHMKKYFKQNPVEHVKIVKMQLCDGQKHLEEQLEEVQTLGGEGLMLRKPQSLYVGSRSSTLLKVKTFTDEEAKVIGHEAGKGKYKGKVGALMCQLANGTKFCVGSGMSDADRSNPPPIGSIITVKYQELTDAGVPRFPSYQGVRIDAEWPPKNAKKK